MKKILLLFCFAICASLSYGQFKVTSDGINHALNKRMVVGEDAGNKLVLVQVGFGRTAAGGSGIDFDSGDGSTFGTRFSRGATGLGALTHQGAQPLQLITQNAAAIEFKTNSATLARMTIQSTGQVDIRGAATVMGGVAVTSDKKLKKNIDKLNLGLEEVLKLNPVTYEYTGEAGTSTARPYVGLIAQELQKVAPSFVSDNTFIERDEAGNVISEKTFLQIHDSELKYMLVNAIQDQQAMINIQAEKIANLEDMINAIGSTGQDVNTTNINLSAYDTAEIGENYPNPFSNQTSIDYIIPSDSKNSAINIYNNTGSLMRTVSISHVGEGTLNINAESLPSGTYTYQLVVDGKNISANKMIVSNK